MNLIFRILVAIYAAISAFICGVLMISPFSDKVLMKQILDYFDVTFYRSNKYDVVLFLIGLVFLLLNLAILFSGIRIRNVDKYLCYKNDTGTVKISAASIENIALGVAKKSNSVKDAKAKAKFHKKQVEISLRLTVFPDTLVPNLTKNLQNYIKETVETMMELPVETVEISIEGVHQTAKED